MTKDQLFFTATFSPAPRTYDKDRIKSSEQGGCVTWQTMAIRQSQKSLRPSRGGRREKRPKKIPLRPIISSHGRCQVDTETMFSIHLWNNECFKKCFQVFSCFVLQSGLKQFLIRWKSVNGGLRGLFVHRPLIQSQCRWPRDQKRFSGAPLKKYKHALAELAKMMMNWIHHHHHHHYR